jgi:hypothetical protein
MASFFQQSRNCKPLKNDLALQLRLQTDSALTYTEVTSYCSDDTPMETYLIYKY